MIKTIKLTRAFKEFFGSERAGAFLLILCTLVSLLIANTVAGEGYQAFWRGYLGPLSIEHWINDALMAIFFLLIGLELERELHSGELSSLRGALLPVFAALGGLLLPALIHFYLNAGTPTQAGVGIPMATDIAFAVGMLALIGDRVPASLKVFLVALAVMDDLGAILVIAIFYTGELSLPYLIGSVGVATVLFTLNRYFGIKSLIPYLIGGVVMWYFMLRSGVHATLAGVVLAFLIPYTRVPDDPHGPSQRLEHFLHKPVAYLILPIFALANTGISLSGELAGSLLTTNSLGIVLGLVAGKPIGVITASFIAVLAGFCRLPHDLNWRHVFGAGMLGGIGFTMSIFITNLAFPFDQQVVNASKLAIFLASLLSGTSGLLFLKFFGKPNPDDPDLDSMYYEDGPDQTT